MSDALSVSVYFGFHDSSVAVADAEQVLLVLESERLFRKKHHAASAEEMCHVIDAALAHIKRGPEDVRRLYVGMLNNGFPPGDIRLGRRSVRPIFTRHHECHIGSVLDHGADRAVIVCADGGSEDGTTRVYLQDGLTIECIDDLDGTSMTGKFYGTLTQMVIEPEFKKAHVFYPGKTMGLAAYGRERPDLYEKIAALESELGRSWEFVDHLRSDFGLSGDYSAPWLDPLRCDVACNGQRFWADRFYARLERYSHLAETLALVGGCALNVLLNSRLAHSGLYRRIHVGPVSGDCGQAVGALLYHERHLRCDWPFLGRGFGEIDDVPDRLVEDLLQGRIVAWYQGRSELGARGLGHRSFLGLPASVAMRDRMNAVKSREPYRPVAPILPLEDLGSLFESSQPSPYMTFAPTARERTTMLAPAIIHHDGTSRLQTLTRESNPVIHTALRRVGDATGVAILMNSSFNVAGEPMADTPDDALRSFHMSTADVLYINGERTER